MKLCVVVVLYVPSGLDPRLMLRLELAGLAGASDPTHGNAARRSTRRSSPTSTARM